MCSFEDKDGDSASIVEDMSSAAFSFIIRLVDTADCLESGLVGDGSGPFRLAGGYSRPAARVWKLLMLEVVVIVLIAME